MDDKVLGGGHGGDPDGLELLSVEGGIEIDVPGSRGKKAWFQTAPLSWKRKKKKKMIRKKMIGKREENKVRKLEKEKKKMKKMKDQKN